MSEPAYPRGSEWRKWDLQVHTPFSALNNGFGDDFDDYARSLLSRAIEDRIAAIGITDYFSIAGYKELRSLLRDRGRLDTLIGAESADQARCLLLVPNIELRTSVIITRSDGSDSRVNFHVIFSDEVDPTAIEDHFLRELKFTAQANPASPDERWSVTLRNLEDLGRTLKHQHAEFRDRSDLYIGTMNAVVSLEDVTEVLDRQASRFKDRFLLVAAADEDLSRCSWNGQGHLTRKLLIQKSHMLFSANPGTREFGLGRRHPTVASFLAEFKSLKPCIHGSDAHSREELFRPAADRQLWIKADPTFRGLQQLLHEPEERVFIGSEPHSRVTLAARPTRVVSSLTVSKKPHSPLAEKWFAFTVPLNPELVAVIGNKGNGKSAFTDILGLLGNTPNHSSFSFLRDSRFRDPKENKARHFEATLDWADGSTEGPMSLDQNPEPEAPEKIRYIPQSYLDEICNEVRLGKGSRFYAELQRVIFSHVPSADRLGFDTLDTLLDHRGAEIEKAISILIAGLGTVNKEIVSCEEQLAPRHRRTLVLKLAEKRRELEAHDQSKPAVMPKPEDDPATQRATSRTASRVTAEQERLRVVERQIADTRASDAAQAKKRATAERLLNRLMNLKHQYDEFIEVAAPDFAELGLSAGTVVSLMTDATPVGLVIERIDADRLSLANQLDADYPDGLAAKRLVLVAAIKRLQESLTAPQRIYQVYLAKLAEWQTARDGIQGTRDLVGSVAYLEARLAELEALPRTYRELLRRRDRRALEILCEKRRLRSYYQSYYGAVQSHLADHPVAASGHLEMTFEVAIAQNGFPEGFLRRVNQRKVGSFAGVEEGAAEIKRLVDATNWDSLLGALRFARQVVAKLRQSGGRTIDVQEQLKQGVTAQALYDMIFAFEYLSPTYRLTWGGRGLEQLSPGERGNLLLVFYLLLDMDDIPLVIDQPEENLDNESVYKTLVPSMKDAKRRRQIVIVTHNPNLAVGCDAEQVIYAEISRERGNEITYTSGSIEDQVINKKIVDVLEGTRPAFDMRESKYLP